MDAQKTGAFIAQLRKEQGLTQAQLAQKLFVSDKVISRWETGKGFPDINNIESISGALGVSIAELLKGERMTQTVPKEDADSLAIDIVDFLRRAAARKELRNILVGFIISLILVAAAVIHMTSPIHIVNPENALSVDVLTNGKLVVILKPNVAGYDLDTINVEGEERETFISCWTTRWEQLTGHHGETIVTLGMTAELNDVYYYPSDGEDRLIYSGSNVRHNSVITLPRLVYNYWALIGLFLGAAGLAAYAVFRKKSFGHILLKAAMVPMAIALGTLFVIISSHGQIYNPVFYLSGVLLIAILIYALFWVLYRSRKKQKSL